jgi:hypothetical protein
MIDDEAALLKDVRFAWRGLDPGGRKPSGFRPKSSRAKFSIIQSCVAWDIHRPLLKAMHRSR